MIFLKMNWHPGASATGVADVVRDFSERHERDQTMRRKRPQMRSILPGSTIAGVVSGEFDRITEVNDAFLEMIGYTRDELLGDKINWLDLTARGRQEEFEEPPGRSDVPMMGWLRRHDEY